MGNTTQKAVNEVFIDSYGVIRGVYHGSQNAIGLQAMMDRMMRIMEILIRNDRPVRLLLDIRDMGPYDQAARIVEMHARTVLPYWRLAFVTSRQHPDQEQISRKLTLMSGRRKEIRYFEREDDAMGWLSVDNHTKSD